MKKIKAIERIDQRILGKLIKGLPSMDDYALAVLPDHPTPINIRTHTSNPIPYAMYTPGCRPMPLKSTTNHQS
nr:hypothetical protein [Methanobacterium formicicum]